MQASKKQQELYIVFDKQTLVWAGTTRRKMITLVFSGLCYIKQTVIDNLRRRCRQQNAEKLKDNLLGEFLLKLCGLPWQVRLFRWTVGYSLNSFHCQYFDWQCQILLLVFWVWLTYALLQCQWKAAFEKHFSLAKICDIDICSRLTCAKKWKRIEIWKWGKCCSYFLTSQLWNFPTQLVFSWRHPAQHKNNINIASIDLDCAQSNFFQVETTLSARHRVAIKKFLVMKYIQCQQCWQFFNAKTESLNVGRDKNRFLSFFNIYRAKSGEYIVPGDADYIFAFEISRWQWHMC